MNMNLFKEKIGDQFGLITDSNLGKKRNLFELLDEYGIEYHINENEAVKEFLIEEFFRWLDFSMCSIWRGVKEVDREGFCTIKNNTQISKAAGLEVLSNHTFVDVCFDKYKFITEYIIRNPNSIISNGFKFDEILLTSSNCLMYCYDDPLTDRGVTPYIINFTSTISKEKYERISKWIHPTEFTNAQYVKYFYELTHLVISYSMKAFPFNDYWIEKSYLHPSVINSLKLLTGIHLAGQYSMCGSHCKEKRWKKGDSKNAASIMCMAEEIFSNESIILVLKDMEKTSIEASMIKFYINIIISGTADHNRAIRDTISLIPEQIIAHSNDVYKILFSRKRNIGLSGFVFKILAIMSNVLLKGIKNLPSEFITRYPILLDQCVYTIYMNYLRKL